MQAKVEWVEVLLVAVYGVYSMHLFAEAFGFGQSVGWRQFVFGLVFLGTAAGWLLMAYVSLGPRKHHDLFAGKRWVPWAIATMIVLYIVLGEFIAPARKATSPPVNATRAENLGPRHPATDN